MQLKHLRNYIIRCLYLCFFLCIGCNRHIIEQAKLVEQDSYITCDEQNDNKCALDSEFQDLADRVIKSDNNESDTLHYASLLAVGEDSLVARIHLARAARESIIIQSFIWDDDEAGQLLFKELLEAARRGVKVRMIIDQFGCYVKPKVMAVMEKSHVNLEIKLFRPTMGWGGKSRVQDIGFVITDVGRLYGRMHNKLFVVDGKIGIVGGRNIQDSYFDYGKKVNFKDLDMLVIGPVVREMYEAFDVYWDFYDSKPAAELVDVAWSALRLNNDDYINLFDEEELAKVARVSNRAGSYSIVNECPTMSLYEVRQIEYIVDWPLKGTESEKSKEWNSTQRIREVLSSARSSIVLQTPYLIQDLRGVWNTKTFRKENPDVEISLCTNSLASTDMFFVYAMCFKQRQFYIETLQAYMYELKPFPEDVLEIIPRFTEIQNDLEDETDLNENPELIVPLNYDGPRLCLHSKFFVVDNYISFVGSHNFDPRAKNLNTENGLIVWDEDFALALKALFDRDTSPQNSWVIARREKPPVVGYASEVAARVSSALPVFDIWPFHYSSNYELIEGKNPLPTNHPDFYEHYENVGPFPQMGLSPKRLGVRFVKAFGGFLIPVL